MRHTLAMGILGFVLSRGEPFADVGKPLGSGSQRFRSHGSVDTKRWGEKERERGRKRDC